MKTTLIVAIAALTGATTSTAQIAPFVPAALVVASPAASEVAAPPAPLALPAIASPAAEVAPCELHVWPTENYLGLNTGFLVGLGPIGVLADVAGHANRVKTVKDLMADYLGPAVQVSELNRIGIANTLKLPGYRIILEPPTPFNEDLATHPEIKARADALNAQFKAKQRLTTSTSKCYAELITTHIFYYKAAMYGSNLFTGWIFRDFGDRTLLEKSATGQVKNPLENFPPKTAADVEAAKIELRDAYSKDFVEYVQKKVMIARPH